MTFGQQNSVYYDVVGAKTDIWDYDMLARAPGNGINGDYDGSYRSRKMLKYKNRFGDADVYASYLFSDSDYLPGNGLRYKRKGGGSLGVDYHITQDLTGAPHGTTPAPKCATRPPAAARATIRTSSAPPSAGNRTTGPSPSAAVTTTTS